jgi:hypothetical protein
MVALGCTLAYLFIGIATIWFLIRYEPYEIGEIDDLGLMLSIGLFWPSVWLILLPLFAALTLFSNASDAKAKDKKEEAAAEKLRKEVEEELK